MARNDTVLAVDQLLIGKAELSNLACDQRHLSFVMRPRIARIGDQIAYKPICGCRSLGAVHHCLRTAPAAVRPAARERTI